MMTPRLLQIERHIRRYTESLPPVSPVAVHAVQHSHNRATNTATGNNDHVNFETNNNTIELSNTKKTNSN